MYSNFNQTTTNTKYTDYVRRLNEDYVKKVNPYDLDTTTTTIPPLNNDAEPMDSSISDQPSSAIKFSEIFNADESHALKLRLLQQAKGFPAVFNSRPNSEPNLVQLRSDADNTNIANEIRPASRRFDYNNSSSKHLVGSSVSVADIVSSSIAPPPEFPHIPTQSDSKVDYDPHEILSSADRLVLRHELLKNIRAISRATYFEDLYTGKVKANSSRPESEVIEILQNVQQENHDDNQESDNFLNSSIIPSSDHPTRVDLWVKESSEIENHEKSSQYSSPAVTPSPSAYPHPHASLFHQSVWSENQHVDNSRHHGQMLDNQNSSTESDREVAPAFRNVLERRPYSFNDSSFENGNHIFASKYERIVEVPGNRKVLPSFISSNVHNNTIAQNASDVGGKLRYNKHTNSFNSFEPGASRSHAPKMHASKSNEFSNHNYNDASRSHAPKIHASKSNEFINYNYHDAKQVQREVFKNAVKFPSTLISVGDGEIPIPRRKKQTRNIPGILLRHNMNQWVAKKVWFFINGDKHFPGFQYRFRPGRDVRDLESLLDILTKRLPQLSRGVRYIFTIDGISVHSISDLRDEEAYVVSSTKKFKGINYGDSGKQKRETDGEDVEDESRRRPPSAPSQHKPPIIRIRRERSLNGVAWGSPQELSLSENNLTVNKYSTNKSRSSNMRKNRSPSMEVPRLVAEVIETSSSQSSSSRPVERQVVRIINGADPTVQSQVLLNTKTSQPWEDLVKDLGMAVKISKKKIGSRMETLAGRRIQSYSQLRSELKAGNHAFYIYGEDEELGRISNLQRKRSVTGRNSTSNLHLSSSNTSVHKTGSKKSLDKSLSNSSSEISMSASHPNLSNVQVQPVQSVQRRRSRRRRSQTQTPSPNGSRQPTPVASRSPSPAPSKLNQIC